ncbi:hypothetical protein Pla110_24170 [Polystyrenella longa]|uniref:Uncharacterized protein n=1 Tax=Polystyrenella longa TaxID=2528007 RepID=A0A518CN79_9PLAN|nr:hypothetical protein Pla110_24170 [Polystyrenella longa]
MRFNNQNIQVVNQVQAALVAGIANVANEMVVRFARVSYLHSAKRNSSHDKPGSLMSWLEWMTGEPSLLLACCCSPSGTTPSTRTRTMERGISNLS